MFYTMDVFFVFVCLSVCLLSSQATSRSLFFLFFLFFNDYLNGRLSRSLVPVCRGAWWCERLSGGKTDGCVKSLLWKKKAIFLQHKWKLGIESFPLAIKKIILLLQPLFVSFCSNWHCDDLKKMNTEYLCHDREKRKRIQSERVSDSEVCDDSARKRCPAVLIYRQTQMEKTLHSISSVWSHLDLFFCSFVVWQPIRSQRNESSLCELGTKSWNCITSASFFLVF